MTLELTAKCNFRCPYCYCVWHEYPALAKPELDLDQWKAVLDQCAADGVDDILFTGGEKTRRNQTEAVSPRLRSAVGQNRQSCQIPYLMQQGVLFSMSSTPERVAG